MLISVVLPRVLGDGSRGVASGASSAQGAAGDAGQAVEPKADDVREEMLLSVGNGASGQGSTPIGAFGDARITGLHAGGDDGVDGTTGVHEAQEGSEDTRSDSGMTMEDYDPHAFDFPRRVNDEMANVLSPTTQTLPSSIIYGESNSTTINVLSPEEESSASSNSNRLAMEVEGEAPPTYDEVEQEAQFIHSQTPTTPIGPSSRPREDTGIVSSTAQHPSPESPQPSFIPPTSPPPAFRAEIPPSPTTTGNTPQPSPTRGQFQPQGYQNMSVPTSSHFVPRNPGKRSAAPTRPLPQDEANASRGRSTSDSSSGNGYDGLMMTSRGDGELIFIEVLCRIIRF